MKTPPDFPAHLSEQLSAWIDSEATDGEASELAGRWRDDANLRADWHAFHLIGDVLRSEGLASTGQHDAEFLQSLRAKLAQEPVVFAPTRPGAAEVVVASQSARRARALPAAAAAVLLSVGAMLWTQQAPQEVSNRPAVLAEQAPAAAPIVSSSASVPVGLEPETLIVQGDQGPVLRDAQIDSYLAAHQQFGGSSAFGGTSGFVRNASVQAPGR
jgi:sigma-E factor negative regulatory protein RseA